MRCNSLVEANQNQLNSISYYNYSAHCRCYSGSQTESLISPNANKVTPSHNLPNNETTPTRTTLDRNNMEALSSIKKALEDATELVEALMINGSHDLINDSPKIVSGPTPKIDERKDIDLTRLPERDDKENCRSDVNLGKKMTNNIDTPSLAAKKWTHGKIGRSPSTTKASQVSSALSKVGGLARALKTINAN